MLKLNISCLTAVIIAGGNVCAYADPDCGDDGAKQKIIEIAKKNQPNKLTDYVIKNSPQFDRKVFGELRAGLWCPLPESMLYLSGIQQYRSLLEARKVCASILGSADVALKTTIYHLKTIRIATIDHDTKAVTCIANLDVEIPDWGAASMSNFKFMIEQTTDGEQLVTVYGLK